MYLVISFLYLVQLGFRVNCLGYGYFVFIFFIYWYNFRVGKFVLGLWLSRFLFYMAQLWFLENWVGFMVTVFGMGVFFI